MPGRADHFDQVVRGHVGGHAHGDAAGTVHQQVRVSRRQHVGLGQLVVVVGDEIDNVFVEVLGHGQRGGGQAGLGVPRCGWPVVEGAEVSMSVNQRNPQRKRLRHAHERVVDGRVPVRVQLAHHLADDPGALHMAAVWPQPHFAHLVQDAPLYGLEPVAGIRQRPRVDHRVGVFQERPLHLDGDVNVFDAFGALGGWGAV